ncbi:YlxR family protein [Leucobacter sp. 1207-22]|uniref:YlxR family protein n=1 Tax=Leucobacter sp. 1207-22 TaxID=2604456 RepID=UPI004063F843
MDAVRTCVGCRARAERDVLLRVVVDGGQLIADDRAVLPGRGAWVHPTAKCLSQAVQRRAFVRALKVSGQLDTTPLENRLKTLMDK